MANTPRESLDQNQALMGKLESLIGSDVKQIIRAHMENLKRTESWKLAKPYSAQEAQHLFESYLTRAISEIIREVIMPNLQLCRGDESTAQINGFSAAVASNYEKFKSAFIEVFNEVFEGYELNSVRDLIAPEFCDQIMQWSDIGVVEDMVDEIVDIFIASVAKGVAEIEQSIN